MSRPRVVWKNGGEAQVLAIAENAIVLRSTVPAPPGSRLEGTANPDATAILLRLKVHRSQREGDGAFVLRGRPLDLTREARQRLEAMISEGDR
jgi:hypothetical protein